MSLISISRSSGATGASSFENQTRVGIFGGRKSLFIGLVATSQVFQIFLAGKELDKSFSLLKPSKRNEKKCKQLSFNLCCSVERER